MSGFRFAILAAISCAAALAHVREAAAQSAGNGADVLPPQLVVQSGHANRVLAVAIAPDETIVATGAEDRQIRLWDLRSGKEFRTLSGHERPVSALTFDASGERIASGDSRGGIRIWSVRGGELLASLRGVSAEVETIAFAPDGMRLATGQVREFAIWDVESGEKIRSFGLRSSHVAFSPDGQLVANLWNASEDNRKILVVDVATGDTVTELSASGWRGSIAFSPDGSELLSAEIKGTARRWDYRRGRVLQQTRATIGSSYGNQCATAIAAQAGSFVQACDDANPLVWDMATGTTILGAGPDDGSTAEDVAISPSGKLVAVVPYQRTEVRIFHTASGRVVRRLGGSGLRPVLALAFSPDGRRLASGTRDGARVWDLATGDSRNVSCGGPLGGATFRPTALRFSDDGAVLIYEEDQGAIYACDLAAGKALPFDCHPDYCPELPDSYPSDPRVRYECRPHDYNNKQWFYSARDSELSHRCPGTVYDRTAKRAVHFFNGKSPVYTGLSSAMSPDGTQLARGSREGLSLLDEASGFEAGQTLLADGLDLSGNDKPAALSFDRDGQALAALYGVGNGGIIRGKYAAVWDVASRRARRFFEFDEPAASITLSPDGTILVAGHPDGTIVFHDVVSGNTSRIAAAHDASVTWLAYSPDGSLLASGGEEGALRLWRVAERRLVATLVPVDREDSLIAIPDGFYMTTRRGTRGVAFRIGERTYPFEQFDLQFNRPDKVLRALGQADESLLRAYEAAYRKRLRRLDFDEGRFSNDFHFPTVELTGPELPITTAERRLSIPVKATDSRYAVARFEVFVNDVPLETGPYLTTESNARTVSMTIPVTLASGRNKIQISAVNDRGSESLRETFEVNYVGASPKPELYVLAIGVSEYSDERIPDLTYAAKDARDVAALLREEQDLFAAVHVQLVVDGEATRDGVLAARNELAGSAVDDQVIVFLAGHGLLDDSLDYFFATSDANLDDLAGTALRYAELEALFAGVPSRRRLIFIDSCHSGALDSEAAAGGAIATLAAAGPVRSRGVQITAAAQPRLLANDVFALSRALFANLERGMGASVLSAASGMEFAYEDPQYRNGLFTYAVLQGIEESAADADDDGVVRFSELAAHVSSTVRGLTGGRQVPDARQENLEMDFPVQRAGRLRSIEP